MHTHTHSHSRTARHDECSFLFLVSHHHAVQKKTPQRSHFSLPLSSQSPPCAPPILCSFHIIYTWWTLMDRLPLNTLKWVSSIAALKCDSLLSALEKIMLLLSHPLFSSGLDFSSSVLQQITLLFFKQRLKTLSAGTRSSGVCLELSFNVRTCARSTMGDASVHQTGILCCFLKIF